MVTYGVTATNQLGTSPPATVQVTWQINPGSNCSSYSDVKYVDIPWGSSVRYKTQDVGGFPQDRVIVYSITIPAGIGPFAVLGQYRVRRVAGAADAEEHDAVGNRVRLHRGHGLTELGASPYIAWNVGSGRRTALQPGKHVLLQPEERDGRLWRWELRRVDHDPVADN